MAKRRWRLRRKYCFIYASRAKLGYVVSPKSNQQLRLADQRYSGTHLRLRNDEPRIDILKPEHLLWYCSKYYSAGGIGRNRTVVPVGAGYRRRVDAYRRRNFGCVYSTGADTDNKLSQAGNQQFLRLGNN